MFSSSDLKQGTSYGQSVMKFNKFQPNVVHIAALPAPTEADCLKLRDKCRLKFKEEMEEKGFDFPEDLVPSQLKIKYQECFGAEQSAKGSKAQWGQCINNSKVKEDVKL